MDPDYGIDEMKTWRSLLEESLTWSGAANLNKMDPYHRIVWEAWMPPFRACARQVNCKCDIQCNLCIYSKWTPRNFDPMIMALEFWMPVIPQWIFENILEQMILPRLQIEVEK